MNKHILILKYNSISVYREYPIRTDVGLHQNKFQAYHFKPLSQFSLNFKGSF